MDYWIFRLALRLLVEGLKKVPYISGSLKFVCFQNSRLLEPFKTYTKEGESLYFTCKRLIFKVSSGR